MGGKHELRSVRSPAGRHSRSEQDRQGFPFFFSRRSERGQELVEFALVVPILILILFGAVDLGRVFHALITITNVAREGARDGIDVDWEALKPRPNKPEDETDQGYAQVIAAAERDAQNSGLDTTKLSVTADCGSCSEGSVMVVTVSYDFDLILGGLLTIFPDTIQRTARMRIP